MKSPHTENIKGLNDFADYVLVRGFSSLDRLFEMPHFDNNHLLDILDVHFIRILYIPTYLVGTEYTRYGIAYVASISFIVLFVEQMHCGNVVAYY